MHVAIGSQFGQVKTLPKYMEFSSAENLDTVFSRISTCLLEARAGRPKLTVELRFTSQGQKMVFLEFITLDPLLALAGEKVYKSAVPLHADQNIADIYTNIDSFKYKGNFVSQTGDFAIMENRYIHMDSDGWIYYDEPLPQSLT